MEFGDNVSFHQLIDALFLIFFSGYPKYSIVFTLVFFYTFMSLKVVIYRKLVEFFSDPSHLEEFWCRVWSHGSSSHGAGTQSPRGMWQGMLAFVHAPFLPCKPCSHWTCEMICECWFEMMLGCVNAEQALNRLLFFSLLTHSQGWWVTVGKAIHPGIVFSNMRVPENHLEGLQKHRLLGLNLWLLIQ